MSTDDSISEDVSSSAALGHDNTEECGGKESEASIISSEDSPSGLTGPEEERSAVRSVRTLQGFIQAAAGAVNNQVSPKTKCSSGHKNRSLSLNVEDKFSFGRTLPVINPSSLQTLTALVQEIRSSGETDPALWKDSEGRWLQLFQLVEKQYQEQILAQHEQYQCQIQLIQDEIKALVQLQNRQSAPQPPESPLLELLDLPGVSRASGSVSPELASSKTPQSQEERAASVLQSSGYGTLCTPDPEVGGGAAEEPHGGRDEQLQLASSPPGSAGPGSFVSDRSAGRCIGTPAASGPPILTSPADQSKPNSHTLTTWAQKQKHRLLRSKTVQGLQPKVQTRQLDGPEQQRSEGSPDIQADSSDRYPSVVPPLQSYLRRSDSLVSEASGLTYWKLEENELYHPLPNRLDGGTFHLQQESPRSLTPPEEPRPSISLREIYRSRHREATNILTLDTSNSSTATTQVLNLELSKAHMRPSSRTSGFSSPFRFSGPSFPAQVRGCHAGGAPISPDSMADAGTGQNHTDTDSVSNASSLSGATPIKRSPTQFLEGVTLIQPRCASPMIHNGFSDAGPDEKEVIAAGQTLPKWDPQVVGVRQRTSSLDDPVVLSLVRQNMREKTSRHIADLRAYYESEISILKEKLDSQKQQQSLELEKANQSLLDRCEQLERALMEANNCIHELESKNLLLERQLAEWPEKYAASSSAIQVLQQRLDEAWRSGREKETTTTQLRARLRQVEEALQNAHSLSDDKDTQLKKEHKMLQDLLAEYEGLNKYHERVKENLVSTEDKLFEANTQISELRRMVSKLEIQIKQLEYENTKARHVSRSQSQPTGAGFFHHPDLLLSPSKSLADVEGSRRKTPSPVDERPPDQSRVDRETLQEASRAHSPPERESMQDQTAGQESTQRDIAFMPLMKALIHMDETRATEGLALRKLDASGSASGPSGLVSCRPTVSFVESTSRASDLERVSALQRTRRSLSPEGHRSSSLPPCTRRSSQVPLSTKRETLVAPLSAKSSPKRCPTENFSTAFGQSPSWPCHNNTRFDGRFDQSILLTSSLPHSSRSKKKLQFMSAGDQEENDQSSNGGPKPNLTESTTGVAWTKQGAEGSEQEPLASCGEPPSYHGRLLSLADTERLFDELNQEKQQIEAALSRIPAAGGRVTLQAKLDEEALEDRLEKINHDLGSIRMTLKRFHVLRSSSNI
ncbi:M-phase phosphoprotein 9 [Scleropages formosus]|uniref:M-phase phosphoprotein 9 n=1 Tax=Scleropages formosus TaxID=113540 RepID=A0A8C9SBE9_SCLFO|nr:M-phase phosphoprotein 9 [Scleropages formosus]